MAPPDTEAARQPDAAADQARNPFTRPWWIVSAVVVAVILGLLIWLVAQSPYHPPGSNGHGRAGAAPVVGARSVCGLPGGSQVPPAVTPEGTHWRLVGTMAAPISDDVGPGGEADKVPVCYAPTPLGALYAAANFVAVTSVPELRLVAAEYLCADGPGRDAALADLRAGDVGSRETGIQIAGFQFIGYSPAASASIDLATTTDTGSYAHFPVALVWTGGDWKVQLPITGTPYADREQLPTLAGYVPFRGA